MNTRQWLLGLASLFLLAAAPVAVAQKSADSLQGGVPGTITDGGVSFEFIGTTDAAGFRVDFTVDGSSQSFSYGFSYRLDGQTQEFQLQTPDSANYVGDTATLDWTDFAGTGLDATMELVVAETAAAGAAGTLVTTLMVENPGVTDRTIDLFIYADLDVNGTAGNDSATLTNSPDYIALTDTATAEFRGGGVNAFQVATWPGIRDLLSDAVADDLDNSGLPFGPGDFTGAMQWQTLDLFAGGSATVETTLAVNDTAPAPADPVIIGGAPPPTIASITPDNGPEAGGTAVTINGSDFVNGATVDIGGNPCTGVAFVSAAELTCTTPAGTGVVDVVVTNPDTQSDTLVGGFTYNAPAPPPSIASIAPDNGPEAGGTAVTINGSDFVNGATVDIGGNPCTGVAFVSAAELTCTTPAGTGVVDVVVTNPDAQSDTLAGGFTYNAAPPPAPSVASITPDNGPDAGGTAVTIAGADFQAGATVTIGGAACTNIVVVDANTITCDTPSGAAGAADVVVENPDAQSDTLAGGFTYIGSGPPEPESFSVPANSTWSLILLTMILLAGGVVLVRSRG